MLKITQEQFDAFVKPTEKSVVDKLEDSLKEWLPVETQGVRAEDLSKFVDQAMKAAKDEGLTWQSSIAVFTGLAALLGTGFIDQPDAEEVMDAPDDTPDSRVMRLDASLDDDAWGRIARPDQPITGAQAQALATSIRAIIQSARNDYPDEKASPVLPCKFSQKPAGVKPGHWIEVVVLDEDQKPLAGVAYRVTAADGMVFDGETDKTGLARIEGLAAGTAKISFPKLDQSAWRALA